MTLNNGDRIMWTYEHKMNHKSSVMITKEGTFIKMAGAIKKTGYVSGTNLKVLFDGNKHPSIIPLDYRVEKL